MRKLLRTVGENWMECVEQMEQKPELEEQFLQILKTSLHSMALELLESSRPEKEKQDKESSSTGRAD
jgi:hypothetical protein